MGLNQQIGQLDRFVQIVQFTIAKSSIGSGERTQVAVKTVWAQLQFISSNEDVDGKIFSINKRNYIIHQDADITAKLMQDLAVIDGGKTYYVTGAVEDYMARGMYILLNCEYRG